VVQNVKMEHFKKLIEVPYEEPIKKQMSDLDKQLQTIINNSNLSVEDKYAQYQQILKRYRFLQDEMRKPWVIQEPAQQNMIKDIKAEPTVKQAQEALPVAAAPLPELDYPADSIPRLGIQKQPLTQTPQRKRKTTIKESLPSPISSTASPTRPIRSTISIKPAGYYNDNKRWLPY